MTRYQRAYLPGYGIAHLLPRDVSLTSDAEALCGKRPGEYWFGNGTKREVRYLATLPTCSPCQQTATGVVAYRPSHGALG